MRQLTVHTTSLLSWSAWAGWAAMGLTFTFRPTSALVPLLAALSLLASTWLTIRKPLLGLYLLPIAMMMGPAYALPLSGAGNVTIGDLYALLLVARVLAPRLAEPKLPRNPYLLGAALLLFASTLTSNDLSASAIGLAKIIEFTCLVVVSTLLLKSAEDWRSLFMAWTLATSVGAVMMLWCLYNGQPHFLLEWAMGVEAVDATVDIEQADTLFRPVFFYTNFFIPLGLSVVYSAITLVTESESSRVRRLFLAGSAILNTVALLLNNTRAMLVPMLGVVAVVMLVFVWRAIVRARSRLVPALLVLCAVGVGAYVVATFLISEAQITALLTRSGDSSPVAMRVSVWTSALGKLADHPARLLLFGWGPEATARQGGAATLEMLRTGSMGNYEGAFDSTIVGFLVEYGLVFTTLVCSYAVVWCVRVARQYRRQRDPFVLAMFAMGLSLVFTCLFQQFGVSPPSLIALQLLAFVPGALPSVARTVTRAVPVLG